MIFGLEPALLAFRALDPAVAVVSAVAPRASGSEAGTVVLVVEGDGARAARRRANRAQLPRAPLGHRDAAARAVAARRGHRRRGARHAQDDARACASSRRRRSRPAAATNHRRGLYDAILIKENHIAMAGGIGAAVRAARAHAPALPLEVEVRDSAEIDEALAAGATRLLLDNMTSTELRAAVAQVAGRAELEASGGVTLETLRAVGAHRRRLRLDGFTDAFGPGARPLADRGAASP